VQAGLQIVKSLRDYGKNLIPKQKHIKEIMLDLKSKTSSSWVRFSPAIHYSSDRNPVKQASTQTKHKLMLKSEAAVPVRFRLHKTVLRL